MSMVTKCTVYAWDVTSRVPNALSGCYESRTSDIISNVTFETINHRLA